MLYSDRRHALPRHYDSPFVAPRPRGRNCFPHSFHLHQLTCFAAPHTPASSSPHTPVPRSSAPRLATLTFLVTQGDMLQPSDTLPAFPPFVKLPHTPRRCEHEKTHTHTHSRLRGTQALRLSRRHEKDCMFGRGFFPGRMSVPGQSCCPVGWRP